MADGTAKPVIFISYSSKDEPEHPRSGEVKWRTYVQSFLAPKVKNGVFDIWVDEYIAGGAAWKEEIKQKLADCDLFILLVSSNSLESHFVINVEIATIRKRQQAEELPIYPIVLTPFTNGPEWLMALNLTPRHGVPLSELAPHDRDAAMESIATEIAAHVAQIEKQKGRGRQSGSLVIPTFVQTTRLPETDYERLVGRVAELKQIDNAWVAQGVNILSLIAEGGAGKSALVNEWLKRLQADNYRGAEAVLGWSFYSQGTKERATSADEFLNWALDKLGIKLETTSASAKGEAIAEEMVKRRVLLVLDGVEPLQHGLDTQLGQLRDLGLRALLRRFAATPPGEPHGLVVLTSRLAVKDISRWRDGSARVIDVEELSDDAGAALLRDNGVWGTEKELRSAAHDFGGHPLALGLLASFLKETQIGDVRRRDHIRAYFADPDSPRHDHAKRVMESYEKEWLAGQPVLLAIMHIVGLFDRPASSDCLKALRAEPIIGAFTDRITSLSDSDWQRAVARLRAGRLLAPLDLAAPDAIDAHPLVREWFGERLRQTQEGAWKAAHGRLYEHLRDTTNEGDKPELRDLSPLYQAIVHGCRAGKYNETFVRIFEQRICRNTPEFGMFYSRTVLGAFGADLAAVSSFFERAYDKPAPELSATSRAWILNDAANGLMAEGRVAEALPALHEASQTAEAMGEWRNAAVYLSNQSEAELLQGQIESAIETADRALGCAKQEGDQHYHIGALITGASALHAAGRRVAAEQRLIDAEKLQKNRQPNFPILYSAAGHTYCDLLFDKGDMIAAQNRALQTLEWAKRRGYIRDAALDSLTLARVAAMLALRVNHSPQEQHMVIGKQTLDLAKAMFDNALDGLRFNGQSQYAAACLLARAAFRRSVADWDGATCDLDEVEEIAWPATLRLCLCDMALERSRLAIARAEAFVPFHGILEKDNPPKPTIPSTEQIAELMSEAGNQLKIAAEYIDTCGYHRRDEQLAELQAVLRGECTFASLPLRV
jgi:tetratricopeptide (TPR) repeat protein